MNTVVFDMGGVLPSTEVPEYAQAESSCPEEAQWLMTNVVKAPVWQDIDRGIYTDEEAISFILTYAPAEYHDLVTRFIHNFRRKPDPNPAMDSLVLRLKAAGYRCLVFSNVGFRYREFFPFLSPIPYMDGLWTSCEYGVIKPEPESYRSFFDKFDLRPEDCFFIDDTEANIKAGQTFGMDGFVYKGNIIDLENALREKGFQFATACDSK